MLLLVYLCLNTLGMHTLMIHEFSPNYSFLDVSSYDLITYDDGLLSQFENRHYFDKSKIFFICPKFIMHGHNDLKQTCMTLEQVVQLVQEGFSVGIHSFEHKNLNDLNSLIEKTEHIKKDTELALDWFEKNLGFVPTNFCYPYNNDLDGIYTGMLKRFGFNNFFGKERIPIETLLHN